MGRASQQAGHDARSARRPDRIRQASPTGTNLIGLVKHLAGLEYGYLGETFGRPPVVRPMWFRDDPATEIDSWATVDESSDEILDVYRQATAHADETIAMLNLDNPGKVPHWSKGHQETTLWEAMSVMLGETTLHLGHAQIVRELIDGSLGSGETVGDNQMFWNERQQIIASLANRFR